MGGARRHLQFEVGEAPGARHDGVEPGVRPRPVRPRVARLPAPTSPSTRGWRARSSRQLARRSPPRGSSLGGTLYGLARRPAGPPSRRAARCTRSVSLPVAGPGCGCRPSGRQIGPLGPHGPRPNLWKICFLLLPSQDLHRESCGPCGPCGPARCQNGMASVLPADGSAALRGSVSSTSICQSR